MCLVCWGVLVVCGVVMVTSMNPRLSVLEVHVDVYTTMVVYHRVELMVQVWAQLEMDAVKRLLYMSLVLENRA